ncbi:MAG: hypothetical protein NZ781_10210, partial [Armatimonadetes bacterium]|nr:hypothetical protein [Armatimonadota bacterium]
RSPMPFGKAFAALFAATLISLPCAPQELSPAQPAMLGELDTGSNMRVTLKLLSGKRTYVTLIPVEGDADLFVLLSPDETPETAKFKSVSPALETERLMLPMQRQDCDATVVVQAATRTRFVLFATWVGCELRIVPTKRTVIKIDAYEIVASGDTLLVAVTVKNATSAWYEFSLTGEGELMSKVNLPRSFVLGPNGERYLGWVTVSPSSKLTITAGRTKSANAFLIADIVSRAVIGTALSPDIAITIDDLLDDLEPLMPVAEALYSGDWKRAGTMLISIVRKNPKVLIALHTLLTRSGIRIPKDLLNTRIGLGFGSISAIITALGAIKAPQKEQAVLYAHPESEVR